jgi:hypothetical protein
MIRNYPPPTEGADDLIRKYEKPPPFQIERISGSCPPVPVRTDAEMIFSFTFSAFDGYG